jgi:uncharacterized protein YkwD
MGRVKLVALVVLAVGGAYAIGTGALAVETADGIAVKFDAGALDPNAEGPAETVTQPGVGDAAGPSTADTTTTASHEPATDAATSSATSTAGLVGTETERQTTTVPDTTRTVVTTTATAPRPTTNTDTDTETTTARSWRTAPEPEIRSYGVERHGTFYGLNQERLEESIHREVEAQRPQRPIRYLDELGYIARYHSYDMASSGYYAHESPDGQDHVDRYERFGMLNDCRAWAENINKVWAYTPYQTSYNETVTLTNETQIADVVVREWMDSPGHRANILTTGFGDEGIGVWMDDSDQYSGVEVYVTQNFCER